MTQRDLSIKTGTSQGHLSNLENGNVSEIGSGSFYALSRHLRTNMAYITEAAGDLRPRSSAFCWPSSLAPSRTVLAAS